MRRILFIPPLLLAACITVGAEPEKYASFECKELSQLQKSYEASTSNYDLFGDTDINELERSNTSRRALYTLGESRAGLRPYKKKAEKDLNSIRAASRLRGC